MMNDSTLDETVLEEQLERLRSVNVIDSAKRVEQGLVDSVAEKRRQVFLSVVGVVISILAGIHFIIQGDPIGYLTLILLPLMFTFTAWRIAKQATEYENLTSGSSLLSGWRNELKEKLKEVNIALFIPILPLLMTLFVISKHGLISTKAVVFILLTTVVFLYAMYQLFVIRPALVRELNMLKPNDS